MSGRLAIKQGATEVIWEGRIFDIRGREDYWSDILEEKKDTLENRKLHDCRENQVRRWGEKEAKSGRNYLSSISAGRAH